jgi:hypothetical protein
MSSDNPSGADNQQERLVTDPNGFQESSGDICPEDPQRPYAELHFEASG